jgi:hypothetical protein
MVKTLRSILVDSGERAIVMSDATCRWLLGHLRDEIPDLYKRTQTPPHVANAEDWEAAKEAVARLEDVVGEG